MKITDVLNKENIELLPSINSKKVLIDRLIEIASKSGKILNVEEVRKQVWQREKLMSTGVGKGIALPHAKSSYISAETGSLIVLKQGVEYDSSDDKLVQIALLLIGQESNFGNHLNLLGTISRFLDNDYLRSSILEAETKTDILNLFKKLEGNS